MGLIPSRVSERESERPTDRPPPPTRSRRYFLPTDGQLLTRVPHLTPCILTARTSLLSLCRDFDPARRISRKALFLYLALSHARRPLLSLGGPPRSSPFFVRRTYSSVPLSLSPPLPASIFYPAFVHPPIRRIPLHFLRCRDETKSEGFAGKFSAPSPHRGTKLSPSSENTRELKEEGTESGKRGARKGREREEAREIDSVA